MMTEDDTEMKWRDLALQFDGHRMQAISFLKMILSELPNDQYASARDFIKSGPLSGEEVLRNRIAALTQPASPALKLPDSISELPCDVRLPNVTYRKGIHTRMLLEGLQRRAEYPREDDEPHTAPIEPICTTGGAE